MIFYRELENTYEKRAGLVGEGKDHFTYIGTRHVLGAFDPLDLVAAFLDRVD